MLESEFQELQILNHMQSGPDHYGDPQVARSEGGFARSRGRLSPCTLDRGSPRLHTGESSPQTGRAPHHFASVVGFSRPQPTPLGASLCDIGPAHALGKTRDSSETKDRNCKVFKTLQVSVPVSVFGTTRPRWAVGCVLST